MNIEETFIESIKAIEVGEVFESRDHFYATSEGRIYHRGYRQWYWARMEDRENKVIRFELPSDRHASPEGFKFRTTLIRDMGLPVYVYQRLESAIMSAWSYLPMQHNGRLFSSYFTRRLEQLTLGIE